MKLHTCGPVVFHWYFPEDSHVVRSWGHEQQLWPDKMATAPNSLDAAQTHQEAIAFIEAFARNGSFGVITSHLGPLKLGWTPESGVINGSLEYDSKSGKPTYLFLMGVAGQSLALQTARRVGVQPDAATQLGRGAGMGGGLRRLKPECKCRPHPHCAGSRQVAIHSARQLAADREAESKSFL